MIKPEHIHYDTCPDCKAPIKSFGRKVIEWGGKVEIHRHVNGGVWEYIIFTCGRKDEYIPNYLMIETQNTCSNLPAVRQREAAREAAKAELREFIATLKVDSAFRGELAYRLGV